MSASSMSDEFDGLDATEKAAVEAALDRCRTLAAKLEANSVSYCRILVTEGIRRQRFELAI